MKSEPTTLGRLSIKLFILILKLKKNWMREPDLNQRPSGYEPDELPSCSTPRPIYNERKQTRYLLSRLRIIRLKLPDAIVLKPKNADYFPTAYLSIKY